VPEVVRAEPVAELGASNRMLHPSARDHFKQINDSHGHGRGDEVLAALGTTVQATLRASDFVGRYGGEEFVILLPNTPREEGLTVAEKIRAAVATINVPGVTLPITASLGLAVMPDDAGESTSLIREADRALYAAKAKGRNRVETRPDPRRVTRPRTTSTRSTRVRQPGAAVAGQYES
jgi:diguanylate cyclase (GGDEF)-like protein